MTTLFGAYVLFTSVIGTIVTLKAIGRGIAKTGKATGAFFSSLGQWFAVRWHGYALDRDKSRMRKKKWQEATDRETIHVLVQQNAALLERLQVAQVMPNVARLPETK